LSKKIGKGDRGGKRKDAGSSGSADADMDGATSTDRPGYLSNLGDLSLDLILLPVISFLFAASSYLASNLWIKDGLRLLLGLPFLFFFLGYSILAFLFPRHGSLSLSGRIAMSLGLSMAGVALSGLMLNLVHGWGNWSSLRSWPVMVMIFILITIFCLISYARRRSLPEDERFSVRSALRQPRSLPIGSEGDGALDVDGPSQHTVRNWGAINVLLASGTTVLMISTSILGAYVLLEPRQAGPYTEFYMLGTHHDDQQYPGNLTPGDQATIYLDILTHERSSTDFCIVIRLVRTIEGMRQLPLTYGDTVRYAAALPQICDLTATPLLALNVSMGKAQHLEMRINFTIGQNGHYALEVLLFRKNDLGPRTSTGTDAAYRYVRLWLSVA